MRIADGIMRMAERIEAGETLDPGELDLATMDRFGVDVLGLVWDSLARDRVVAHLDVEPRHHQPFGTVHGGVWAAIVESLASTAATLRVVTSGRVAVGVSNATEFVRPHAAGRVDATATPIHVGRSQQLWLVELTRATGGKLIARGQLRVQNVDGERLQDPRSAR